MIFQELSSVYKAIKEETKIIRDHPIVRNSSIRRSDTGDYSLSKYLDDHLSPDEMLSQLLQESTMVNDSLNKNFREKFFRELKKERRSSSKYDSRDRRDRRYDRGERQDREYEGSSRRRSGNRDGYRDRRR